MWCSTSPGVLMLATGCILLLAREKTGTTNAGELAYQKKGQRIKKNSTFRARRNNIPWCILSWFGQDLLQLTKTTRSICLLSKGPSPPQVPQQHKNCNYFCWKGKHFLLTFVMSDINRGGLLLKTYKCK